MEHKGFKITREAIGRSGTYYQYRCGNIVAPRKKDVIRAVGSAFNKGLTDIQVKLTSNDERFLAANLTNMLEGWLIMKSEQLVKNEQTSFSLPLEDSNLLGF